MSELAPTGGQTVGPFFGYALPFPGGESLVPIGRPGAVQLSGLVLDGAGHPVPDALVEIWQADPSGAVVQRPGSLRRDPHDFTGWGRCPTDPTGRYRFTTLRPGGAAPFFAVTVFARGLTDRLFTRAYLPGSTDALLSSLEPSRRETLIITEDGDSLVFDIHLQGDDETVFLTFPGPTLVSLLEPASWRAGATMSDEAVLDAMLDVEDAWLVLRGHPGLRDTVRVADHADLVARLGRLSESAGNPVVPLVEELRTRLRAAGDQAQADAVHLGLTSQDVLDTALALCCRATASACSELVDRMCSQLCDLALEHRSTLRCGRTLTQPAVPTTFGAVVATWLHGVLDAAEDLQRASEALPVQVGGAAGTLAGPLTQVADPATALGELLGLPVRAPWHSTRAPVTRFGDALVAVHDACALIANDVLLGSRPEIGELSEGTGGGSSTMPHKHNPVLSVLVRAGAISAPGHGATLHAAAAAQVDQRADGGWHAEWPALAQLGRSAVQTLSLTSSLLDGLHVDAEQMAAHAHAQADDLLSEARRLGAEPQRPEDYLGAVGELVDGAVARASTRLRTEAGR